MKKILILIVLIAAVIGGGIGTYLFNKKVGGLENLKADYTITSTQLYDAFESDEKKANEKYLDKILLVKGIVVKHVDGKEHSTLILKADNALAGGINCSFNHTIKGVSKGDVVLIKGRCQGFLMDVVLNNCNIEYE